MSYILDALRKSDQQRQRGTTPTLHSVQVQASASAPPRMYYYILSAVMLLIAGVVIGWLQPWRVTSPTAPAVADMPVSKPLVVPEAASPASPSVTRQGNAVQIEVQPETSATDDQRVYSIEELPATIRQSIPEMTVQLHAYSDMPRERLVSINSVTLREGDYMKSGLRLEQITPDGMIFSYQGYHFRHGIR